MDDWNFFFYAVDASGGKLLETIVEKQKIHENVTWAQPYKRTFTA